MGAGPDTSTRLSSRTGWRQARGTAVTGPLIWLDENGEPNGTFDVFDYIALCREHYAKNGIGADYIDRLFR